MPRHLFPFNIDPRILSCKCHFMGHLPLFLIWEIHWWIALLKLFSIFHFVRIVNAHFIAVNTSMNHVNNVSLRKRLPIYFVKKFDNVLFFARQDRSHCHWKITSHNFRDDSFCPFITMGSFWVWARPLKEGVTLQRRSSLADLIPWMVPTPVILWDGVYEHKNCNLTFC